MTFHQQTFVTNNLRLLRSNSDRRPHVGLRPGRSFTEIQVVKTDHLEMVAAHAIGKVTGPCKSCAQTGPTSKGYFSDYVIVLGALDYASLGGRYTNCAFQGFACSHTELSSGKKVK